MYITVTHYKGGVAKTTTAVHLAAYLQQLAPTLLIDPKLMKDARQQALDAYEGTDQNIKRVANIGGSRGSGARAP